MTAVSRRAPTGTRTDSDLRVLGAILPIALLIAFGMAYAFYRFPPTGVIVAGGTLGLGGAVALALARYEAAVALGFLLLGAVVAEPAPADAIFAVVMAIALVTGRFDLQSVPLVVFTLLGTFLALNLLSAVEAVDPGSAGRFMLITLYLAVFAVWLAGFVNSRSRARLVVRFYIAGAVAAALVSSLALYLPVPSRDLFLAYNGTRGRGLFEDPNVYGPFLIPAALILVEELLSPRLLRSRPSTKLVLFCILAVGVLFSYSRGAWVSMIAALVVLLGTLALRRGGGRRAARVLGVMVAGAVTVGGVLAVTGSLGFLQQRATVQTYDVDRFGAQQHGFQLAEQYPFGIGPGQFDVLVEISTHSTYVRVLAEQGMLGFLCIFGLLVATLILAGRNAVLGRDTYGVGSAALLAAWVALLINSFVVDTLHWRHLFFVAALIWAGSRRPIESGYAGASEPPLTTAGRRAM